MMESSHATALLTAGALDPLSSRRMFFSPEILITPWALGIDQPLVQQAQTIAERLHFPLHIFPLVSDSSHVDEFIAWGRTSASRASLHEHALRLLQRRALLRAARHLEITKAILPDTRSQLARRLVADACRGCPPAQTTPCMSLQDLALFYPLFNTSDREVTTYCAHSEPRLPVETSQEARAQSMSLDALVGDLFQELEPGFAHTADAVLSVGRKLAPLYPPPAPRLSYKNKARKTQETQPQIQTPSTVCTCCCLPFASDAFFEPTESLPSAASLCYACARFLPMCPVWLQQELLVPARNTP